MENSKDFTNTKNNTNKIPTKPSEYRPISVLPVLSKVFERIILNQLKEFIDKHEVYQLTQSGHRKRHCTLNSSEVVIALFANSSKAFDTIRYDILLNKYSCSVPQAFKSGSCRLRFS